MVWQQWLRCLTATRPMWGGWDVVTTSCAPRCGACMWLSLFSRPAAIGRKPPNPQRPMRSGSAANSLHRSAESCRPMQGQRSCPQLGLINRTTGKKLRSCERNSNHLSFCQKAWTTLLSMENFNSQKPTLHRLNWWQFVKIEQSGLLYRCLLNQASIIVFDQILQINFFGKSDNHHICKFIE